MSVIPSLLSSNFRVDMAELDNASNLIDENEGNNAIKNEGGLAEYLNQKIEFDWLGKGNNSASVDGIKGDCIVEIKGSNKVGKIQLNSTPITCKEMFIDLPKKGIKALSQMERFKNLTLEKRESSSFNKEYLFLIKKEKVCVYVDPNVEEAKYNCRRDYEIEMQDNLRLTEELKQSANILYNDVYAFESLKKNSPLHAAKIERIVLDMRKNRIINDFQYSNKYTRKNNNAKSYLDKRDRAMWSFDLANLLVGYGLDKEVRKNYAAILILSKERFEDYSAKNLPNQLFTYILDDGNVVILGNNKT